MELNQPAHFGPLVECCAAHGISRTVAFKLAADGSLETFAIGSRRYVVLQSLWRLPETLRTRSMGQAA